MRRQLKSKIAIFGICLTLISGMTGCGEPKNKENTNVGGTSGGTSGGTAGGTSGGADSSFANKLKAAAYAPLRLH